MDIAFHYFAVKALSVLAGFSDDEAQVIAENSQMTDDFDYWKILPCTNIPSYIRNNVNSDLAWGEGLLNPAQTGFLSGNTLIAQTDYLNLVLPRFQKLTCTPFHFLYETAQQAEEGQKDYRVIPAVPGDGSLAADLLEKAKADFRKAGEGSGRHRALMQLGIVLHIWADTWAHQLFSGCNSKVNDVRLQQVLNNCTATDETAAYRSGAIAYLTILRKWAPAITPTIGHMMLAHIPDLTHLSFTMNYTDEKGNPCIYTRSNTDEFLEMAKHLLDYLRDCLGGEAADPQRWEIWKELLRCCFLTDISKLTEEKDIVDCLSGIYGAKTIGGRTNAWVSMGATFHYSSSEMKKAYLQQPPALANEEKNSAEFGEDDGLKTRTTASDDFYLFNAIAEGILIYLYGPNPRRFINMD